MWDRTRRVLDDLARVEQVAGIHREEIPGEALQLAPGSTGALPVVLVVRHLAPPGLEADGKSHVLVRPLRTTSMRVRS
jgi:hypothetical protein